MSDPLAYIEIPRPVIVQGGGGGTISTTGSLAKGQIAIWNDAGTSLTGFSDLIWSDVSHQLLIDTATIDVDASNNVTFQPGSSGNLTFQAQLGSVNIRGGGNICYSNDNNGITTLYGGGNTLVLCQASGKGSVLLGPPGGLLTGDVTGFTYIAAMAGTPAGTPNLNSVTNSALVVDTSNDVFYFFSGGAWRSPSGIAPAGGGGDVQLNNGSGGFSPVTGTTTSISNVAVTTLNIQNGVITSANTTTGATATIGPVTSITTSLGIVTAVSGPSPVADGTYTLGLGLTQNGTITTSGGIITAIQQVV